MRFNFGMDTYFDSCVIRNKLEFGVTYVRYVSN